MKTLHLNWTIEKLSKNLDKIEFPEFQREPTVWDLEKKQRLIDSIIRDFDISSIYFFKKENGGYDCIDGRQRINAIFSFLGINEAIDKDDNEFHLVIENEIYDDGGIYNKINSKRFASFDNKWQKRFLDYKLNIVEIIEVEHGHEEELNLLFLRLQIASVLNAGEKLNAMTGDMRDWIFLETKNNKYFKAIKIPNRRYAKEQVAAQIAINYFNTKKNSTFQRSRYIDLQIFFKQYSDFSIDDRRFVEEIKNIFNKIVEKFDHHLGYIRNRAIAVSVFLFVSELIAQNKEAEISQFVSFFERFLKTLKWQLPKGIDMNKNYQDLLNFQTNITQAAGEKTAIQKRHDFLKDYFSFYLKNEGLIKGDKEYQHETGKEPDSERNRINLST